MPPTARPRFKTFQDWHEFVNNATASGTGVTGADLYAYRSACYAEISAIRGRPLIVYAVSFNPPPGAEISVGIDDVDGFVDIIRPFKGEHSIDVLIHSPGGSPEATERIVSLLRGQFEHVGFLVPHSAYSAATMLALSGDEIILHPAACLGPIDPQIGGIPVRALRRGFDKAKEAIRIEGPEVLPAYVPLLEKYKLETLEIGEDFEKLSVVLATEWLTRYMFQGSADKGALIERAVSFFANYDEHRTHARPLTHDKLAPLGLNISVANGGLDDLLWEAHILIDGFLSGTGMVKLYENGRGISWGRNAPQRAPQPQQPPQPPPQAHQP